MYEACPWCADRGCLQCDGTRAARLQLREALADADEFLRDTLTVRQNGQTMLRFPMTMDALLELTMLAIQHGREAGLEKQAAGRVAPVGVCRFEMLELEDGKDTGTG